MSCANGHMHLGYVVKRYPRFSETFIVNEILAHERAGVPVEIFAVRRVNEPHFQSIISQVRSPVHYINDSTPKVDGFWNALKSAADRFDDFWAKLDSLRDIGPADLHQGICLALAAQEAGVTHLHAHFATIASTIARIAALLADLQFSVTAHAKDIFLQDIDRSEVERKLRDASKVVTVSEFNVGYIADVYDLRRPQVCRIYNGLRLSEFPYRSPVERAPAIVAVGRLVPKKGFADLIEACAILQARGVEFTCEIIGEGSEEGTLQGLVKERCLDNHVHLCGAYPRPIVAEKLSTAAISALPCVIADDGDRDGLPTVLIEAMALGTPCISTDVTGIPELVRHMDTGLQVPQRDPLALADALELLLRDAELRERLATNARAVIERDFDVDRNARRLRELFDTSSRSGTDQLAAQWVS